MKRKLLIIFSVIILVLAMTTSLVACKHTHNWKDEWQTDATHHWHECEKKGCKEKGDYDNHSFKIQNDEDYHWNLCSVCGYATSKVAHTFDDNLVCTGCGAKHIHKISYHNETHRYDCDIDCGVNRDEITHTFVDGECTFCSYKEGSKGLAYELNSDGKSYKLLGIDSNFDGTLKDVVIAEYYDKKPVTIIAKNAFYANVSLLSVYIPKSIVTIETRAFYGCKGLAEITIPSSVMVIEEQVFEECYGITIKVQDKSIKSGWTNDWQINSNSRFPVVLDCDNNDIADDGYIYFVEYDENVNTKEKSNIVKYGVKGDHAIIAKQPQTNDDIDLKPAVKYNGTTYDVTKIDNYAFYRNDIITAIDINRYIEEIGDYAFYGCSNLSEIYWRRNSSDEIAVPTEKIGNCAFAECINLNEFEIPKTITYIGAGALQGCSKISKIVIPQNVERLGAYVFSGCLKLIIRCEASSKPQGWNQDWNDTRRPVIWNCGSSNTLEDGRIILENDGVVAYILDPTTLTASVIYQEMVYSNTEITISQTTNYNSAMYNITELGENLFAGNEKLEKITLYADIVKIGAGAFANCTQLKTIEFKGTMAQWNAIDKGEYWNYTTGSYVIKCSDGTLDKAGNVL